MEKIQEKSIITEVKQGFIDYAMSVILARAIPNVKDGLKPVHRRVLYAMHESGMNPDKPHKKSARIVGDVLGKYHPHGDTAVYDALVRMGQEWVLKNTLVDIHGNYGSIEGDAAAAMRYTESRLSKISTEMVRDIDKETVSFSPNYDGNEMEPDVLPSRIPNLLVNGSEGIAVGMATSMPTHNLRETCEAIIAQIDNPEIALEELMKILPGPDFPTGAYIMGTDGIVQAYETGRGSITMRAVTEIETDKKGKSKIIVREIPYLVNRKKLMDSLKDLQDDWDRKQNETKNEKRKLEKNEKEGYDYAADIWDEGTRDDPIQFTIVLKRGKDPHRVLSKLFKSTDLQKTFGYNAVALVPMSKDSKQLKPEQLSLKKLINYYVEHQLDVNTKVLQYDLKKYEARIHILEGLLKALNQLDEVVETFKTSSTPEEAKGKLMILLDADEVQAKAVLDMRMQRLVGLEQEKLRNEHGSLEKAIEIIHEKLNNKHLILEDIKNDLREIAKQYGDERRTRIMPPAEEYNEDDHVEEEEVVVTMTHEGYIKRTPESVYSSQRRNGRGVNGMKTYEDDFVEQLQIVNSKDVLLFFTNNGRVYQLKAHHIPESKKDGRGVAIQNILELNRGESIKSMIAVRNFNEEQYLFFTTEKGMVKKTSLDRYKNIYKTGIAAITLKEGDSIVSTNLTDGKQWVIMITKNGKSIKFNEEEVKSVGRTASGVKGIVVDDGKGDVVVSCVVCEEEADILTVTENGYGKRTSTKDIREQSRNGKGTIIHKVTNKSGPVVGGEIVQKGDALMLITKNLGKSIKLQVKDISKFGRNTQGTKVINTYEGDVLQALARIPDDNETENENLEEESENQE